MAALKCDDGAVGTWPGQWGAASRVCFGDPPVYRVLVPVLSRPLRGSSSSPQRHAGANLAINVRYHHLGRQDGTTSLLRSSSPRRDNVDLSQFAGE